MIDVWLGPLVHGLAPFPRFQLRRGTTKAISDTAAGYLAAGYLGAPHVRLQSFLALLHLLTATRSSETSPGSYCNLRKVNSFWFRMSPGDGGVYWELLTSSSEKSLQPQEMPAKNRPSRVFMARVGAATERNSGPARNQKKNKRQDAKNQSRSTGQNGSSGTFTREGDAGGTCVPLRTCRVGSETSQTILVAIGMHTSIHM